MKTQWLNSKILFFFMMFFCSIYSYTKNRVLNKNFKQDLHFVDTTYIKNINIVCSQLEWSYSSFDSIFNDLRNVDSLSITEVKKVKICLNFKDQQSIVNTLKKVDFNKLPLALELKKIYYYPKTYSQVLIIFNRNKIIHIVTWDGIFPKEANNNYANEHKRKIKRLVELNDTIYSILKRKVEFKNFYKNRSIPIIFKGLTLKEIGFPMKYITKVGNFNWVEDMTY